MKINFDPEKHEYEVDGVIPPSVTQILKSVGLIDDSFYSDDSAAKGLEIHELTKLIDEGFLKLEKLKHHSYIGYLKAWDKFKFDFGVGLEAIEKRIYHPNYNYAGTLDRIADIKKLKLKNCVIDIKTGQSAKWHGLQLWGYAMAENTENMMCVYIKDNGHYKIDMFEGTKERNRQTWISALNVYNFRYRN
jgi:hypothetical protein